ncbi:uncharacterized protein [Procambarus clarkii]|uniref:uncharacterized protein n=1 Tax=Procambarus clarkii TaxID=6728 RepID=UPI003743C179
MLAKLGEKGEEALMNLINRVWVTRTRPLSWNRAIIVPIPRPKVPVNPRLISLTSCLVKTAERMALKRIKWKANPLHQNMFACKNGVGTTECLTSLLDQINDKPGILIFLDLEKAFELANAPATLCCLGDREIDGHALAFANGSLLNLRVSQCSSYTVLPWG